MKTSNRMEIKFIDPDNKHNQCIWPMPEDIECFEIVEMIMMQDGYGRTELEWSIDSVDWERL